MTTATFILSLSALTSRTISGNYATANSSAFGGVSCKGVDYENASGMFSFPSATRTLTIPIKVCGDTNAEASETFRVILSSVSGASLPINQGVGTILNDDVLELVLEDSGPTQNQATALDALFAVRDPFRIEGIPEWFPPGSDRNTRIALFIRNLQLNPGELPSAVIVRFTGASVIIDVAAEDVQPVPNTDLTQVVVRLPNSLVAPGNYTVFIRAHTRSSNIGTIRILP